MKRASSRALLLALLSAVLLVSCAPARTCPAPEQTNDGWQTACLAEVGIDEGRIGEAIEHIHDDTYKNVHSVLIVKDGKLVFEEYFSGYKWDYNGDQYRGEFTDYGPDTIHNLASVTKSFTSALVGIAIDQGFSQREDLQQPPLQSG